METDALSTQSEIHCDEKGVSSTATPPNEKDSTINSSDSEHSSIGQSLDLKKDKTAKDPVVIMVAGKVGNGKTTALNNIFGLNLETKSSPTSVTTVVSTQEVEKNGVTIQIIDTPGLGSATLETGKVVQEMTAATKGKEYTLLYCLAVRPNDNLTETDKTIIRNLQHSLGKQVWQKCVLLLTFSDVIRRDTYESPQEDGDYITFLKEHAQQFQKVLRECKADIHVKTIFEYKSQKQREKQETSEEVIAVPIKRAIHDEYDILPGISKDESFDWTDIVFIELMKKKDLKERMQSLTVKSYQPGLQVPGLQMPGKPGERIERMLVWGAVGAVVGGLEVGTAAGAFAGAIVGAASGGTVGLPMYRVVEILKKKSSS